MGQNVSFFPIQSKSSVVPGLGRGGGGGALHRLVNVSRTKCSGIHAFDLHRSVEWCLGFFQYLLGLVASANPVFLVSYPVTKPPSAQARMLLRFLCVFLCGKRPSWPWVIEDRSLSNSDYTIVWT